MSTIIAPGAAADSGAAPAREQAAVASAARAGRARGSVPRPDNHVIVVFGATGDLAHRKLLPGLFHLATAGLMPDRYQIIGLCRALDYAELPVNVLASAAAPAAGSA